jgi:hypothetical protein
MTKPSERFIDLASQSGHDLDAVFEAGTRPDVGALTGYEFRGYNQPPALALLGIRKFIKAFYRADDGRVFGCNTPVAQNGLRDEWQAKPSEDQPKRYAFFLVEPTDAATDGDRGRAVLLDYGRGGNGPFDPARLLRDYLVQVEPGSDDLLLGKAYLVVAGRRPWHSYFVIERLRPLRDGEALARGHRLARAGGRAVTGRQNPR